MGDWVLSGSTNAPDNSKILVTVYDKESENYGNNGSESAKSPAKLAIVQDGKCQPLPTLVGSGWLK